MTNIIFFGSSIYSTIILKTLVKLSNFPLKAIVTKPDKPIGRLQTITKNPVAKFADKHHLPLFQPQEFNPQFVKLLKNLKPDLVLVVAYGPPFFNQEMIDIPKYKIINIHPSPLPKYRGATPGPWQIINGETRSAVTFFQIDSLPDHGPIIRTVPFAISSSQTAHSFYQKAFKLAAKKLSTTLSNYIDYSQKLTPQDHSQKSYYPKLSKNSAQINWSWTPTKINRFIQALIPWPIAWTYIKNQKGQKLKMKIFSSHPKNKKFTPNLIQIEGKTKTNWDQVKNYYKIIKN